MKYDNSGHDVFIDELAEIYAKRIRKELSERKDIAMMSYDSSTVGTEFIEYRQTVRTGGSFSPISPWEHDIVTIVTNSELEKGIVVMHDPHYRDIIKETVLGLNEAYGKNFPVVYERKLHPGYYFNKS